MSARRFIIPHWRWRGIYMVQDQGPMPLYHTKSFLGWRRDNLHAASRGRAVWLLQIDVGKTSTFTSLLLAFSFECCYWVCPVYLPWIHTNYPLKRLGTRKPDNCTPQVYFLYFIFFFCFTIYIYFPIAISRSAPVRIRPCQVLPGSLAFIFFPLCIDMIHLEQRNGQEFHMTFRMAIPSEYFLFSFFISDSSKGW